jgi:hypothetical protein
MLNKVRIQSILLAGGLLLAGFSVQAQVVGSQHDLTNGGTGQGGTANTDQVCVFCHTPHGADTNAPVPLWNKTSTLGNTPAFTRYSTLATPSLIVQDRCSTFSMAVFLSLRAPWPVR